MFVEGKSRTVFFPSDTLIYGISREGSENYNIRTCEHMILGQLRMGARQTNYASLWVCYIYFDWSKNLKVYNFLRSDSTFGLNEFRSQKGPPMCHIFPKTSRRVHSEYVKTKIFHWGPNEKRMTHIFLTKKIFRPKRTRALFAAIALGESPLLPLSMFPIIIHFCWWTILPLHNNCVHTLLCSPEGAEGGAGRKGGRDIADGGIWFSIF